MGRRADATLTNLLGTPLPMVYALAVFETCSDYTRYGTLFLRSSAYKVRVGGVSPRCGIEQIREGGIGSSAHSQSEQYLIGERFVPPTITINPIQKINQCKNVKNIAIYLQSCIRVPLS